MKFSISVSCFYSEDAAPKFSDYRPVFFEGHAVWVQNSSPSRPQPIQTNEQARATHPFTAYDEGQQYISTSARVCSVDFCTFI